MTVYYYLCHKDDICILLSKIVLYFVLECVGAIDGTHFSARTLSSKISAFSEGISNPKHEYSWPPTSL